MTVYEDILLLHLAIQADDSTQNSNSVKAVEVDKTIGYNFHLM